MRNCERARRQLHVRCILPMLRICPTHKKDACIARQAPQATYRIGLLAYHSAGLSTGQGGKRGTPRQPSALQLYTQAKAVPWLTP